MTEARFAIFGTGFWSRFQLLGWMELDGVECVALYNRTRSKAEALADEFGIPNVYDDPEGLLDNEKVDFIDVITDVSAHEEFVLMAAEHRVPVICQKPMAPTLEAAERMVRACRQADVPLFVHENWRWQRPIREFKKALDTAQVGRPFRARIDYLSSLTVWDQQPALKEAKEFIIADMGSHILDVARFLFGEAETVYCQTDHVHAELMGEDVASVMMRMGRNTSVTCNLCYAGLTERERPSQTCVFVEAEAGSLELAPDYWIRVTTVDGTFSRRCPPPVYPWAEPFRQVVQASIVSCNANLLQGLTGTGAAETTGEDNLRTSRLVHAAYESARTGKVVEF